jgi:hypothetical protein
MQEPPSHTRKKICLLKLSITIMKAKGDNTNSSSSISAKKGDLTKGRAADQGRAHKAHIVATGVLT